MRIDGDVEGGSNYFTFTTQKATFAEGLANPDVVINGTIKNSSYYVSTTTNGDSYAQIKGITGNTLLGHAGTSYRNYIGYAILVNTEDYTSTGAMTETSYPYQWTQTSGKLCIVMNGTASQSFTSRDLFFFGGVKAISGTLKMNFDQRDTNYFYLSSDKSIRTTAAVKTGESTYAASSFSHGNLEMLGGTFGSTDSATAGAFRFTNIVYTDGTINLRLNSASQMDTITLESYYNVNTTIATSEATYDFIAGGTVSKTEDSGKITFNFGDNLAWLIDAENDGVKIIAWDTENKSSLTADDFAGNTFKNTDGKDYTAAFAVNDDGLYVKYVAVPEPAAVAAIFGAMALAFAAYRRRK